MNCLHKATINGFFIIVIPPSARTMSVSQETRAKHESRDTKRGACSVCPYDFQIHNKDGNLRLHGPTDNRCTGSYKPPLYVLGDNQSQPSLSDSDPIVSIPPSLARSHGAEPSTQPSTFDHPNLKAGTVRHIPKSARAGCAIYLMGILHKIDKNVDDTKAWSSLLSMGEDILLAPKRTGKKHNLASIIRRRIGGGGDQSNVAQRLVRKENSRSSKPRTSEDILASVVTAKIEDGNLRAAVRLLCSEESIAPDNEDTYQQLCLKHPTGDSNSLSPISSDTTQVSSLEVTEAEVLKAVKSFPAGSSAGPDGVRPQHVLQMLSDPAQGRFFLTALTGFINLLLRGKCHPAVRPILFGANLIALKKKSGGIRPIAVGYTWRRIAAKCANCFAISMLSNYLQPLQLGVGVRGGCEAAVHATRRFVANMPDGWVVAKLDYSNAFNTLHRDAMLAAVHSHIPQLDSFCSLAYEQPSVLRYGERQILSSDGVQQGDPLGPLLFSLTLHPLLSSLKSVLRFGYLDDVTVGGEAASVEDDVDMLRLESPRIGLNLSISKCEVISSQTMSQFPILSSFIHQLPVEASLLGAPLLAGPSMDTALSKQCNNLERAITRLKLITAHDALTILRHSLSAPKLNSCCVYLHVLVIPH